LLFAYCPTWTHRYGSAVATIANQAEALRKRWLIASYLRGDLSGAYWGIQNSVSEYPLADAIGYSKELAVDVLAKIRTDMDRFSDDEIAALENHGYTLADAAYRAHVAASEVAIKPLDNRWWPAAGAEGVALEVALRDALSDSSVFRALGH
jgi:hypothetical protein